MPKVVVTKYDNGPVVITGEFELVDGKGNAFQTGETIALCRCGQSKTMPLCDGAHKTCGYEEFTEAR
jgi:CDGSH-type Zn-finger protein